MAEIDRRLAGTNPFFALNRRQFGSPGDWRRRVGWATFRQMGYSDGLLPTGQPTIPGISNGLQAAPVAGSSRPSPQVCHRSDWAPTWRSRCAGPRHTSIVALKPTHGRIPMTGVWLRVAPHFWHVGPMARSVRDIASAYALLAGLTVRTASPWESVQSIKRGSIQHSPGCAAVDDSPHVARAGEAIALKAQPFSQPSGSLLHRGDHSAIVEDIGAGEGATVTHLAQCD